MGYQGLDFVRIPLKELTKTGRLKLLVWHRYYAVGVRLVGRRDILYQVVASDLVGEIYIDHVSLFLRSYDFLLFNYVSVKPLLFVHGSTAKTFFNDGIELGCQDRILVKGTLKH